MRLTTAHRALRLSRSLSAAANTTYSPPLRAGILPAYDQALLFLSADKTAKLERLARLEKEGEGKEGLEKAEVEAWVNDPETRWRAEKGLGDMSKPIYRHLAERAWRRDGTLAILMQRVEQMSVTPDLLPSISPEADVSVRVGGEDVVPGVFLLPAQTREGVEVSAQVFHADERLYTLLLVDPDVPDEESRSFTTFAHWLVPNIPLSSTLSTISAPALLPFIPPHPQQGTPYHRYTLLLLAQPLSPAGTSAPLQLAAEAIERHGIDVRAFVREHRLEAKGVHFWREKWDRTVGEIYVEVLGEKEPRFGREKRRDPYKEERDPKYALE